MKVVLCHGCFDILHIGHIMYLEEARKLGDRLVVSVTSDRFLRKQGHPIFTQEFRIRTLCALRVVDQVRLSDHETACETIEFVKPAFFVKGKDYAELGIHYLEKEACERVGAQVVYTTTPKWSSSALMRHFK